MAARRGRCLVSCLLLAQALAPLAAGAEAATDTHADAATAAAPSSGGPGRAPRVLTATVGVYGSTVCGVAACVAAARMGESCALAEPTGHLFGMSAGGLSSVDKRMAVGGIALEIFGATRFPHIEPHVQNATLTALLEGAGPGRVTVTASAGGVASVARAGARLTSVSFESGLTLSARVFLDCSYEGDLLRQSNTSFAVGRESSSEFGEPLAGVNGGKPWAATAWAGVSPWADPATNATLLPTVSPLPSETPGSADGLVMSCNYRLCLTNNASNRMSFDAPAGYNASQMEWLRRWWTDDANGGRARNGTLQSLFLWEPLANSKADVNQGSMQGGSDMPFLQRAYPLASWAERRVIAAKHEWWTRAVWEFLRTDDSVPEHIRAEAATWGLPKDEWPGNGGFPPQLYIRESIRMRGDVVMTQHDVYGANVSHSNASVGLSQWCVDVHSEQRIAVLPALTGRGWEIATAGDVNTCGGGHKWQLTEVPYGALTPKRVETDNLLVPVCASFTHIGFATYRLEPQYAVFGHSAGVAAVLTARAGDGVAVQGVGVARLQAELRAQGQILVAVPEPANGAMTLQPCGGPNGPAQQWAYVGADGSVRLTADGSLSSCASVFGYSNKTGATIVAANCHTDSPTQPHNQAFDLAPCGANATRVVSRMSGLCVGAPATAAGTPITLRSCDGPGTDWVLPADPWRGAWTSSTDPTLCVTS